MEGRKDGQMDRGKTVYPPPPSGSGGIDIHRNASAVQFEISRIPFTGVVTRLGWIYRAENVFGSLISMRLILSMSCYPGDRKWTKIEP